MTRVSSRVRSNSCMLLETPEPNLSRAMQWCNVSYPVWFNLRHGRGGHLFQGRFGADLVQDDAGWQKVRLLFECQTPV